METVIEKLKNEINNNEKVTNSVLGNISVWRNSHYEVLASIINSTLSDAIKQNTDKFFFLGNSISHITLKRIYEGQVSNSAHTDLRFLKSLDKLAIFLGYDDLNNYIAKGAELEKGQNNDLNSYFFVDVIKKCCTEEFNLMKNIDKGTDYSVFNDYVIEDSPYLTRIKTYSKHLEMGGAKMIENSSSYQIYNFGNITRSEEMVVINAEEFWNINFTMKSGVYTFHEKNAQTYFFREHNGQWKIWDNFNPNLSKTVAENENNIIK